MKLKLLSLTICIFISIATNAQTIAAWDFTGLDNVESATATTFSTNLVSSSGKNTITRGGTAGSSVGINSFRTTGFKNDGISTANTDYFQITLQATTGNKLSLSNINAKFKGTASFTGYPSGSGVLSQFAYSLDGTNFTLIGAPVLTKGDSSGEVDLPQQSLSSVTALQNVPSSITVTLRYYATGETNTGGWGFFSEASGVNGLTIGGTLQPSTPPTFAANFPAIDNVDQTTFDLKSNINAIGNTYYVVLPDGAPAPTALQVSEGEDASGSIATISGSLFNAAANTTYTKMVTGLVADVAYDVYVIAKDLNDNLQASPVKIDIVTSETPLPVALTAFTGTAINESIVLNWSTASEQNNDYFEVQHSADGKSFKNIGTVDGAGTSTTVNTYSFVDENPNAGTNYYRLVQHDFDGKTYDYFIIGLNSKIATSKLDVYAGADQLKVFISSANQTNGTVEIYEIGGKRIQTQALSLSRGYNTISLPFSLQPGVHFVRLTTDSELLVKKFIR